MAEEKKPKSPAVALISALAALLTALGTLFSSMHNSSQNDLMLRSMYEVTTKLGERVAVLEATCRRVSTEAVVEDVLGPVKDKPECESDDDCDVVQHCIDGKCMEPVAEAAPPPLPPVRRPKPALDIPKFEDIKAQVQQTGEPFRFHDDLVAQPAPPAPAGE